MLTPYEIESLQRHAKLKCWSAKYLRRNPRHPDNALVLRDLLEVVKTDEYEFPVVRITEAGRAALSATERGA